MELTRQNTSSTYFVVPLLYDCCPVIWNHTTYNSTGNVHSSRERDMRYHADEKKNTHTYTQLEPQHVRTLCACTNNITGGAFRRVHWKKHLSSYVRVRRLHEQKMAKNGVTCTGYYCFFIRARQEIWNFGAPRAHVHKSAVKNTSCSGESSTFWGCNPVLGTY